MKNKIQRSSSFGTLKRKIKIVVRRFQYFGSGRHCPVCSQSSRMFLPTGLNPRPDAMCPICGSMERDRLALLFLRAKTDLFNKESRKFLHVAPEIGLERIFSKAAGKGYLTADLLSEDVMEKMDITDIHYQNNSFEAIYCSHVLEHVPDDRKAIKEFYRILKQGGWAILNVPIGSELTFECPSITDPQKRLSLFGQEDHVRKYGPDYKARLIEAGFKVQCYCPEDLLSTSNMEKYSVSNESAGKIFFCTKP